MWFDLKLIDNRNLIDAQHRSILDAPICSRRYCSRDVFLVIELDIRLGSQILVLDRVGYRWFVIFYE